MSYNNGAKNSPAVDDAKEVVNDEDQLLAPFHYVRTMPGKQVRSKLAKAFNTWLRIDEDILNQIMEIVEMLHNASLMIDDIEDDSVLRRGFPVTHAIYEQLLELHRGQGKEIYWRDTLTCPTEEQYSEMVVQKTGGLFFLAVQLMQLFSEYHYNFSNLLRLMALFFQIRDDYLNLTSAEMADQKTLAEDLSEGKFSFPIIHAIQHGQHNDDRVLNILRQKTKNIEVKKYCISLIKDRGSFNYTLEKLSEVSNEMKQEIESLGGNGKLREVISLLEESIRG